MKLVYNYNYVPNNEYTLSVVTTLLTVSLKIFLIALISPGTLVK